MDLSQIPLAPNLNGDPPNFDGGPSLQTTILGTGVAFITLSLAVVLVRLVTSFKTTLRLHLDDYLCLIGAAAGISYWFVFYELQVKHGIAKHTWDIAVSSVTETVTKGQVASQVLTSIANPCVKASILVFFLRLFGTLRWIRILCYTLLTLIAVFYGAYFIALLSLCIPGHGEGWDSALVAKCNRTTPATILIGVFAVIVDIIMFVTPFLVIVKLNAGRDRKRGLSIVFLIGFLIVVTSVVGLAYRIIIEIGTPDPIWNGANVSITAYTEILGTVIVSCTPALSSFWVGFFAKTRIYSSIRSRFSRMKLQSSSEEIKRVDTRSGSGKQSHESNESGAQYGHGQSHSRLHTPGSRKEAVAPTANTQIPLQSIQRDTLITQHSTVDPSETGGQASETRHQYREQW
ncbi:hypothetical protein F4861DRAFT_505405 [Xylaria intraflava]|nr:hypothetical protein F4861DRAFT_505405 [Xylaria intraflava]